MVVDTFLAGLGLVAVGVSFLDMLADPRLLAAAVTFLPLGVAAVSFALRAATAAVRLAIAALRFLASSAFLLRDAVSAVLFLILLNSPPLVPAVIAIRALALALVALLRALASAIRARTSFIVAITWYSLY